MKTLNEKINLKGNREQHHAVSINKNQHVLRHGSWVNNTHVTKKTGCTLDFQPFY